MDNFLYILKIEKYHAATNYFPIKEVKTFRIQCSIRSQNVIKQLKPNFRLIAKSTIEFSNWKFSTIIINSKTPFRSRFFSRYSCLQIPSWNIFNSTRSSEMKFFNSSVNFRSWIILITGINRLRLLRFWEVFFGHCGLDLSYLEVLGSRF